MSRRPRRVAVKAVAGVVGSGVLALALLGGEAVVASRRTGLTAESAPPVEGSFGAAGGSGLELVMLGDSTAAGVGASDTAGTVGGQLAAAIAGETRRVRLSSVAVSGSRAADLGPQVSRALLGSPDVAVILIGANDATHLTGLRSVRRNVAAAVRRLRAAGVRVVLGACPDMGGARVFPQPLRLVVAWQGRRVAAAELTEGRRAGAEVVDIGRETGPAIRADAATLASDDFHLSDRGYRLWARALLPAVRAAAEQTRSTG
jgi:lysophospholipase L1-like esterase